MSEGRIKFRFSAKFQSEEDEKNYTKWRNENNVDHFFFMWISKEWPRECRITAITPRDKVDLIKSSQWYMNIWDPGVLELC